MPYRTTPRLIRHILAAHWVRILVAQMGFFFVIFAPLLLVGRVYKGTDAFLFDYPMMALMKHQLFSATLLWNNFNFGGFPSLLLNGLLFQPFAYLVLPFFSPSLAVHVCIWLYASIGALCMALTFERMGFSKGASFITGMTYPFTLWVWAFSLEIYHFIPLFALLTLAVVSFAKKPIKLIASALVLLGIGGLTLHIHYVFLLFLAVILVGIAQLASLYEDSKKRDALRFGMALVSALAGACVVSLLRLLPILSYTSLSSRALTHSASSMEGAASGFGIDYFVQYFFPETYFNFLPHHDYSILPYIGVLPLAFVLIGISVKQRRALVLYCVAIYVFTLSLLLPDSPTLHLWLLFPLTRYLGEVPRNLYIGTLALLPLVAIGAETVLKAEKRRVKFVVIIINVIVGLIGVAVGLTASFLPTHSLEGMSDAALALYKFNTYYQLYSPKNFTPILTILMTALILLFCKHQHRTTGRLLVIGHSLLLLMVFCPMVIRWTIPNEPRGDSSIVQYIRENPGLTYGFLTRTTIQELYEAGVPTAEVRYATRSLLVPNTNLESGLPVVSYFDPLYPRRMGKFLSALFFEETRIPEDRDSSGVFPLLRDRTHLLDILNVRHIVTVHDLEGFGYRKELTTQDLAVPFHIFANGSSRPFAYTIRHATILPLDEEQAYERTLSTKKADTGVIECRNCVEEKRDFTKDASVHVDARSAIRTEVNVNSSGSQIVILSQPVLPGWKLLVDNKRIEPSIAYSIFLAVPVEAGRHQISFRFSYFTLLEDSLTMLLFPSQSLYRAL